MANWNHHSYDTYAVSHQMDDEMLDDYYECLIECEDNQSSCKRICRELLIT